MDVQVTDRDGVTAFQQDAGIFVYAVETFIDGFSVTDTVTYSRREAVVKGRLIGNNPTNQVYERQVWADDGPPRDEFR